jgi:3-oxoacid CoA-transferase B subunit
VTTDDKPRMDQWLMAARAAREVRSGTVVNLGMGIPTLVSTFVDPSEGVLFHSENGMLGFGPVIDDPALVDPCCVNAGGQPVERIPGMAFMSHDESFALIRGGWIDLTLLGSLEVGANGDLANYHAPGKRTGGIGGGQDLAFCAKRVVVLMTHQTKEGAPKLLEQVTLPLTAPTCVDRVITDIAVIDVEPDGMVLREVFEGWTADDVQAATGARLRIADDLHAIDL